MSFKQPIFYLLQPSLVEQLLPAPRLNAFVFDAPRRIGTVLGTVAAQLPYPVVAVLDLRRVLKGSLLSTLPPFSEFPGRQTGLLFLNAKAVRPDWCQKTPVAAAAARSPPRFGSRRRHCAPRLASYLTQPGQGLRSFYRPPRGGGEAPGISREQPRFHRPRPRSRC